jgi:GntR family transcriptional regulator/MocR family aminotransferase
MDLLPQFGLDRAADRTLTEQLVAHLRDAIVSGSLGPGDALPPSRRLAVALGISRSVVTGAYEQLLGEAFLETVQGSGTRVSSEIRERIPTALADAPPRHRPGDAPSGTETSLIDLRTGRPFVPREPPREWTRAFARAARRPWAPDAPPPRGARELRELLAAHTWIHRGLQCSRSDVIVTTGTSEALVLAALALRRLSGGAPRIAVEDPGYREGADALGSAGATLHPVPVESDGVTVRALAELHERAGLDAVMLTPSHQFPLGGRMPASERLAVVDWAHRHGVVIIEDDYDSEFRHSGAVLPAVASMDPRGSTIYVASLNKILFPGLRCGMIVMPRERDALRDALLDTRDALGAGVAAHTQDALADFIGSGGFKRAVARSKREYQHRRGLVLDSLARWGISAVGADGGLHVVIMLPGEAPADETVGELAHRGVLVEALSAFGAGRQDLNGFAIGYGAETIPRLMAGLETIVEVLRPRMRNR